MLIGNPSQPQISSHRFMGDPEINHWKVLYKLCVLYVDRNSRTTTTAGHSFYIGPIGERYRLLRASGFFFYHYWRNQQTLMGHCGRKQMKFKLYHQCLPPKDLWSLDVGSSMQIYVTQVFVASRWFVQDTSRSSAYKSGCHVLTEISFVMHQ